MVPSSTKAREDDGFVVFALQSKTKIRGKFSVFMEGGAQKNSLVTKIQSQTLDRHSLWDLSCFQKNILFFFSLSCHVTIYI